MINYKAFFPYEQMRPEQDEVLKQIAEHWDDKKYFILQLDVGIGKSGIGKTVANWSDNAYIITETKQLQDQYMKDFSHEKNIVSIMGKNNYQCNVCPKLTCDKGLCQLKLGSKKESKLNLECTKDCAYYKQRNKALLSHVTISSYAYMFKAFNQNELWKKRDLIVFDECHSLEDQLVMKASFDLCPTLLDKEFGLFNGLKDRADLMEPFVYDGWEANEKKILRIQSLIADKLKEYDVLIEEEMGDTTDAELFDEDTLDNLSSIQKRRGKLMSLCYKLLFVKNHISAYKSSSNWLIMHNEDTGALQLTPLYVNNLFGRYCADLAEKFIFMSATILDIDGFIKELGLPPEECLVIKKESTFDSSKSPICYLPCGSMNFRDLDANLPKACDAVKMILSMRKEDKGIIHTGNYKIATYIKKTLKGEEGKRLLFRVNENVTNQDLLRLHERTKNSVLLSPSMITGVDLKDDLSRFQVIVKMPFFSLGDVRTKAKADVDYDWYVCQMLKNLIQACGRSTRSAEDYSTTYVLDSSFKYWVKKYESWLPQSFLKRIKGF